MRASPRGRFRVFEALAADGLILTRRGQSPIVAGTAAAVLPGIRKRAGPGNNLGGDVPGVARYPRPVRRLTCWPAGNGVKPKRTRLLSLRPPERPGSREACRLRAPGWRAALTCRGGKIPGLGWIRQPTTYHGALTRLLPVRTVLR